tara:strand:+ start:1307 stop:1462 length:156 start_codon:yes stop_codon:yes gene_type:complete
MEMPMSNRHNDSIWETIFDKHLEQQLKRFKDVDQAELEAMVLAEKEMEEGE